MVTHFRVEHAIIGFLLIAVCMLSIPKRSHVLQKDFLGSQNINYISSTSPEKPSGCVPHLPSPILSDPSILSHPAVTEALDKLNSQLPNSLADHRDGISIAVVHASAGKIYSWNHGYMRLNESKGVINPPKGSPPQETSAQLIDGNSIFRIASITKMFTVLEALVLSKRSHVEKGSPRLTLETRVKDLLPAFSVNRAYGDDVDDITLAMLGSHRAGLERDTGLLLVKDLHNVSYPPTRKATRAPSFGDVSIPKAVNYLMLVEGKPERVDIKNEFEWPPQNDDVLFPKRSRQSFLKRLKHSDPVWRVGEMASYSNSGFNVLAFALEAFQLQWKGTFLPFRKLAERDIFSPLNMSHSFLGPIPQRLLDYITVPNLDNLVDLEVSEADDGPGGMFSSSNDLSTLLHRVLLSETPSLISAPQRQVWLRPSFVIADGVTSVGIPWEVGKLSDIPGAPTFQIYAKGGTLPGHYSHLSFIPELGYGIVNLVAIGSSQKESYSGAANQTSPSAMNSLIHTILAPAFLKAYHELLERRFAGTYVAQVPYSQGSGVAEVEFLEGMLVLKKLIGDGVDVLLTLDQLFWMEIGKRDRMYGDGAKLWGTGFENTFRAAPRAGCSWGAFDPYQTVSGVGLDKIVFERDLSGQQQLVYKPLNLRLTRLSK